ncbi:hypothetical protein HK098_000807 [Nowakowskiella sp. JEL0407]|nr:hypothetical protein HK098_000807 [Nowakowskiella sp. JEL0407]
MFLETGTESNNQTPSSELSQLSASVFNLNEIIHHCKSEYLDGDCGGLVDHENFANFYSQTVNLAIQGICTLAYEVHKEGFQLRDSGEELLSDLEQKALQLTTITKQLDLSSQSSVKSKFTQIDLGSVKKQEKKQTHVEGEAPKELHFHPMPIQLDLNLLDRFGTPLLPDKVISTSMDKIDDPDRNIRGLGSPLSASNSIQSSKASNQFRSIRSTSNNSFASASSLPAPALPSLSSITNFQSSKVKHTSPLVSDSYKETPPTQTSSARIPLPPPPPPLPNSVNIPLKPIAKNNQAENLPAPPISQSKELKAPPPPTFLTNVNKNSPINLVSKSNVNEVAPRTESNVPPPPPLPTNISIKLPTKTNEIPQTPIPQVKETNFSQRENNPQKGPPPPPPLPPAGFSLKQQVRQGSPTDPAPPNVTSPIKPESDVASRDSATSPSNVKVPSSAVASPISFQDQLKLKLKTRSENPKNLPNIEKTNTNTNDKAEESQDVSVMSVKDRMKLMSSKAANSNSGELNRSRSTSKQPKVDIQPKVQTDESRPPSAIPSTGSLPPPPPPPPPPSLKEKDYVIAINSFSSETEGCLQLIEGKKYKIINWDYGNGWVLGENEDNISGIFPKSYVA